MHFTQPLCFKLAVFFFPERAEARLTPEWETLTRRLLLSALCKAHRGQLLTASSSTSFIITYSGGFLATVRPEQNHQVFRAGWGWGRSIFVMFYASGANPLMCFDYDEHGRRAGREVLFICHTVSAAPGAVFRRRCWE